MCKTGGSSISKASRSYLEWLKVPLPLPQTSEVNAPASGCVKKMRQCAHRSHADRSDPDRAQRHTSCAGGGAANNKAGAAGLTLAHGPSWG